MHLNPLRIAQLGLDKRGRVAVRRYCGLTLREAGAGIGGLRPSAVAMLLKRWDQTLIDTPGLAKLQRQLTRELDAQSEK